MKETSKCFNLRKRQNHFNLYLNGKGIDIGCGDDKLEVENGSVDAWDLSNGDAMLMAGIPNQTYDFVYSSHCLEHVQSVEIALYNWCRILKKDGFLYFVVPEYVLYERLTFPSLYNYDHKQSFSYYINKSQVKRENHYHYLDVIKILENLNMKVEYSVLEDENYDYDKGTGGDQTRGNALAQICFIAKKIKETPASQMQVDDWVLEKYKQGFFLDVGCFDGETISNTYKLEKYGWNGICIDAFPQNFSTRPRSKVIQAVITGEKDQEIEFTKSKCPEISGVTSHLSTSNWQSWVDQKVTLKSSLLQDILNENKAPEFIEYLNLDIEGMEYEALKNFDFNKYKFGCLSIEHNYKEPNRSNIKNLLESKGYKLEKQVKTDDLYVFDANPTKLDVVIISYAKNKTCEETTIECIKSLLSSEENSENIFNIIVVESNTEVNYDYLGKNIKTYAAPLPYGYHKFLNFGRKKGTAEWVALCNNDLIFNRKWFTKILEAHAYHPACESFSPMCPITQNYDNSFNLRYGYSIRKQISGWCLVHKRSIYEKIGDLDERFIHWCCDSDFAMTLFKNDIKHALVTSSVVYHHNKGIGKTTKYTVETNDEMYKLTIGGKKIFDEKYPSPDLNFKVKRHEIINKLIKDNEYKSYVEIGFADGENFRKINCNEKISIDPKCEGALIKKTSDEFFESLDPNTKYDIIFVDGLHIEEQVDKDISNALLHLSEKGCVVVHDTNPPSVFYAKEDPYYPPPVNGAWNGTVYKSIMKIRSTRNDLQIYTVDTDWGVTVIQKGQSNTINNLQITYDDFENRRTEILNLISTEEFMTSNYKKKFYKVGLCMIVKNESKIIRRCLNSVKPLIDYVCITDTGSTDNTIEIINSWMKENNIDGRVHQEEWKNFAHNRSLALENLRKNTNVEYALMIDADEILTFDENINFESIKNDLTADLYYITCKFGNIEYARTSITKNNMQFFYKGVVHEFLECKEPIKTRDTIKGVFNVPVQDSARNETGVKFDNDIKMLEEALKTEQEPFMIARYTFYLAQSYRDNKNLPKALYFYEERAKQGLWDQEVYISLYQVAKIKELLEYPEDDIVQSYMRAYEICPFRIEAIHGAINFCRRHSRNNQAYILASYARNIPVNKSGLFVETWIWDYGIDDEFSISSYWSNHYKEGYEVTEQLLKKIPENQKPRVLKNLEYLKSKIIN